MAVRKQEIRNKTQYKGNPYIRMIEEKLNDQFNNYCVECGNENPEYISINNGIFICEECVPNHFKFPKSISKIIKNDIKSLTFQEIQPLLCGGNKALLDFISNEFPKLSEFPPNILYRTKAMIYYRQNLEYLIKGGIPPEIPSDKSAYKIFNFYNNYNSNNINENENDFYSTIREKGGFLNNLNNINTVENYDKFYQSNNDFGRGRKKLNSSNNFSERLVNTINNIENNYENYIINKPRQINFQNNNNIIIGNIDNNIDKNVVYSPQKIKFEFKEKKETTFQNKRSQIYNNCINNYLNSINEVYVKPKLVLSPKSNKNLLKSDRFYGQRNGSVEYTKKNNNFPEKNEFLEKGEIINFKINTFKDNIINQNINLKNRNKCMNKTLSQGSYIKSRNPLNYIKKNKIIHKSLSQKLITNDMPSIKKKNIIISRIESKESIPIKNTVFHTIYKFNKDKICNTMNPEFHIDYMENTLNNNINGNTHKIMKSNFTIKNDENYSSKETFNYSEVDSLPIKINLKLDKQNKDQVKNGDKRYMSSYNSKNDLNKSEKKKNYKKSIRNDNKNKLVKLKKDNMIEERYIEKKNNIPKRPLHIRKNCSQENICKYNKEKTGEICKNDEKIIVSVRSKYKIKIDNNK